jgi:uncharacterized protein YlxW (UPF0749 family)
VAPSPYSGLVKRPQPQEPRAWWRLLLWPGRTSSSWAWRFAAPVAFACAGLLAATSAINARGTDLRGGRNESLIQIVGSERAKVVSLNQQTSLLEAQVAALTQSLSGGPADALQHRIDAVSIPSGLRALAGPGIVVTLNDAPRGQEVPEGVDPKLLVVHSEDIQAVANALWTGGAEGMSLQGNRVISTTGIKCVGNTVVLQGVPYAPPYRIVALGDPSAMYRALLDSPGVRNYRDYVPPPYNLGWSVRTSERLGVPAYVTPVALQYARPAG